MGKIHRRNLKVFFSRTTEPIPTKRDTKHPWVKGIQVCSIEGSHPFPKGDNNEKLKDIGSEPLGLFQPNFAQYNLG